MAGTLKTSRVWARAWRAGALIAATVAAVLGTGVAPAAAHPDHDRSAPSSRGVNPGLGGVTGPTFSTDNIEHLAVIPTNADSAGGRVVGNRFFITDDRGVTVYDTTRPEAPTSMGFLAVPQMAYVPEEDVDTNGRILLIGSDVLDALVVVDVSDGANPHEVGRLGGTALGKSVDSHTTSCILDCAYLYNSNGLIIDLRDPTRPTAVGDWTKADDALPHPAGLTNVGTAHDVTEVTRGKVVTSSTPILQLDASVHPEAPTVVGRTAVGDSRYNHGNLWPSAGTDRWLLMGTESSGSCDLSPTTGGLDVYDTRNPSPSGFTLVDSLRLDVGDPTVGLSPYDQYCGHWFTTHPGYLVNGVIAMAWYEHGTRLVRVDRADGHIQELGWFVPVGGSTSGAYWVTDKIIYATDYQRGIDILRVNDPALEVGSEPVVPELPPTAAPIALTLFGTGLFLHRRHHRRAATAAESHHRDAGVDRVETSVPATCDGHRHRRRSDRSEVHGAQTGGTPWRRSEKCRSLPPAEASRAISSRAGPRAGRWRRSRGRWPGGAGRRLPRTRPALGSTNAARSSGSSIACDLVGVHGVDRGLGAHHRDLGGGQGDASRRARRPGRTWRRGRRRRPCGGSR